MNCPRCGNPPYPEGKPPNVCSPGRCDAWVTAAMFDHASREWAPLDDLDALPVAALDGEEPKYGRTGPDGVPIDSEGLSGPDGIEPYA